MKDEIPNLQLLLETPNMEKSSTDFEAWLSQHCRSDDERKDFARQHLLPDADFSFMEFPAFFEGRRQLLLGRLVEVLGPLMTSEGSLPDDVNEDRVALIRRVLTRIPLPDGQRSVLKALYDAGDEGLLAADLATTVGRTEASATGVLGGMGNRINGTPGLGDESPGILLFFRFFHRSGTFGYVMLPELRSALELEGLVS